MVTSRYIDPTTDFGFKRLFGREDSKEILKAFLEAMLELPHPIADLSYIPPEQLPASPDERIGIYDVYCIDTSGRRFIVEMQRGQQIHFRERSLYYATFPITEQVRRGEVQLPYKLLPIYVIGVLVFTIDDDPRHRRRIQLCDLATGAPFYDKLTFVYIELPKFQGTLDQELSPADQWVYLLRHMPALLDIPAELDREPFAQVFRLAEEAALSPEDRARYERSWKDEMDDRGRLMTARLAGREEGREEGAAQMQQAIARALLEQGIPHATIMESTGLTAEELAALQTTAI